GGGWRSEEQCVVLAAVECGVERGFGWLSAGEGMEREQCGFDLGGDVGGGAEMGEVGGEGVGEVDAGGGEAAAEDRLAGGEAGLRIKVGMVGRGGHPAHPR